MKRGRKKAVRLKAEERMAQICETTARIIGEKGYEKTSMREIARQLQVTAPSLYYHVKNKQHLLFLVMNYGAELIQRQVIDPLAQLSDPEEKLKLLIKNHVKLMVGQSREVFALIYEQDTLLGRYRLKIQASKRQYVDLIKGLLSELKESGRARDVDVTAATFALLGMINWIYKWFKPEGRLSGEELAEQLTDLFLYGYLRKAPTKRSST